jgi:hypothetical protein
MKIDAAPAPNIEQEVKKCLRQNTNLDQGARLNTPAQIAKTASDPDFADKASAQPAATSATHEVTSLMRKRLDAERLLERSMSANKAHHALQRRNATMDTARLNAAVNRCARNPAAAMKSFVSISAQANTEKRNAMKAKFAAVDFGPLVSAFITAPLVLYRVDS